MEEKTIYCTVKQIRFFSEENGFAIFNALKDMVRINAKGYFPGVDVGQHVKLTGKWEEHPRYGRTFVFSYAEVTLPDDKRGIQKYLASGVIKGIGPSTAKKIVDTFGDDTFSVLDNTPERLSEVPGIGRAKTERIIKSWKENHEVNKLMRDLAKYEIPPSFVFKIYRRYGADAMDILKQNPYRLCAEIDNIGFKTADKIAIKLGFSYDSPLRLQSGISYVLRKASEVGHCYLTKELLIKKSIKELEISDASLLIQAINDAVLNRYIIREGNNYYIKKYYYEEMETASNLLRIARKTVDTIPDHIISNTINIFPVKLDESQMKAIHTAVSESVMILTGGPGTGKTTITKAIIQIFENAGLNVSLASPTGKAAKRLSESTERDAKTIHRLLEYSPISGFRRNGRDQLFDDAFIIDECSMIDISLMKSLLEAIPSGSRVIFVGDADQLPSVGPGNVLQDMITSNEIPVVRLQQIHRQEEGSAIIKNSVLVNSGKIIDTTTTHDFQFFETSDAKDAQNKVVALIKKLVADGTPASDIQVLYPTKNSPDFLNTYELNAVIQSVLNPRGEVINHMDGKTRFRVGDRVMQLKNNYDKDVFNGDCGYISRIDREFGAVMIDFGNGEISYEYTDLDEVTLAYACTVHKSQGSEYKVVILPYIGVNYMMRRKNLLYTAISRSKEKLYIIGNLEEIAETVKNDKREIRLTTLSDRLRTDSGSDDDW